MPTSFPFLVTTTNMLLTTCTAKYTTHLLLWSTQKQGISTETKFHDLTDLVAAGRCSSVPVLLFWTFLCFQPQFMHFYGPLLLAATLSQILHLLNRWIRQQVYIPTGTSHFGILFLCSPVVRSFLFVWLLANGKAVFSSCSSGSTVSNIFTLPSKSSIENKSACRYYDWLSLLLELFCFQNRYLILLSDLAKINLGGWILGGFLLILPFGAYFMHF